MNDVTDVHYPFDRLAAWQAGDDYASVELIRGLSSPNLVVRVLTREILKESDLKTLLVVPRRI